MRTEQFSQLTTLSMVSTTRVKSFEFWGLRLRVLGASFSGLGSSFSSFGCFVFEIWVLRASVFVFETTHKRVGVALQATVETLYEN